MSEPKEIHYFGRDNSERPLEWYEKHFESASGRKAVGEGSTSYTHPDIIDACVSEIADLIPDCRLIYMVRDPLKRLESDWRMRKHEGWAAGTINEAVIHQATLITHGKYWQNLSVYRRRFTDGQILIVFLEDLSKNPNGELARCFKHIGVDPIVASRDAKTPRNRAADLRKDGRVARKLRQNRFFGGVKRHTPQWMIDAAKSVLLKKQDLALVWDPDVRRTVLERLKPDSAAFLEHCGKPVDFWENT